MCNSTAAVLEPYQITKYFPYGGAKVAFKPEEMTQIRTFGDPGDDAIHTAATTTTTTTAAPATTDTRASKG